MLSNLYWAFPFCGIILSLAFMPLVLPHFWHRHYGKIIIGWVSLFLVPSSYADLPCTINSIFHVLLLDYFPFILLIGSLFIVTGGIRLHYSGTGNPLSNVGILLLGTVLAGWIGTTGASILLIRPLMRANAWRLYQSHIFIFFIFLVANIGGALTPLGDPPLFVGFLKGVPFFWPLQHLMGPTFFVVVSLLSIFFIVDSFFFKKEDLPPPPLVTSNLIKINGRINFLFLGFIILVVFLSGSIQTGVVFKVMGNSLYLESIVRDISLIFIAILSLKLTRKRVREDNHFTWDPLIEVSKVFFGIFITLIPVLSMLKEGNNGPFKALVEMTQQNDMPNNILYFWSSGLFSSFLDNAPTYLVFFFMAGGDVSLMTNGFYKTLMAISMGSVYLGALTYIGNAPNFMVRSIVEHQGVKMPSFFTYMLVSCLILVPIFFFVTYFYLR